MALVTGEWATISLSALSTGTNPLPSMDGLVLDAIDTGSSMLVFCVNNAGTLSEIAFLGGRCRVQNSMVTAIAATQDVTNMDDGDVWTSVRRSDGAWLFFSEQQGAVRALTVPGALGLFIS